MAQERVLVVDAANVVGSRPDGWWRDRAGAAGRLLDALEALPGTEVTGPDGDAATLVLRDVVAVLEGRASPAAVRPPGPVRIVLAQHDGDTAVVACAREAVAEGRVPLVVTADRGLRARLPAAAEACGPAWLNALLGR